MGHFRASNTNRTLSQECCFPSLYKKKKSIFTSIIPSCQQETASSILMRKKNFLMTLGQTHDRPLSVPRPSSGTSVAATTLEVPELFVLALREADDHIGLAGSQG